MSPCSKQTNVRKRPGPLCAVTATGLKLRTELCPRSVCQPVQAQPILRHLIGPLRMGLCVNMHPKRTAQEVNPSQVQHQTQKQRNVVLYSS